MINNIDPTAPSGGRPSGVKLPTVTPEKGYESLYEEARKIFSVVFSFIDEEKELNRFVEEMTNFMTVSCIENYQTVSRSNRAYALVKLCITLLMTHIIKTKKGDFFSEVARLYDPQREKHAKEVTEAIIWSAKYNPIIMVAVGDIISKKGRLINLLNDLERLVKEKHSHEENNNA